MLKHNYQKHKGLCNLVQFIINNYRMKEQCFYWISIYQWIGMDYDFM